MIPEQYLSEIEEMAAIAQDAYGRGDTDECLMALDSIIENIENVMASLEAKKWDCPEDCKDYEEMKINDGNNQR
jgi:hypothetical protein